MKTFKTFLAEAISFNRGDVVNVARLNMAGVVLRKWGKEDAKGYLVFCTQNNKKIVAGIRGVDMEKIGDIHDANKEFPGWEKMPLEKIVNLTPNGSRASSSVDMSSSLNVAHTSSHLFSTDSANLASFVGNPYTW